MKLQFTISLLMRGSFALPSGTYSTFSSPASSTTDAPSLSMGDTDVGDTEGVSDMCASNDADLWTRDNWDNTDIDDFYTDWYSENIEGGDHLDEEFAGYWGLGPSFSCDVDNPCDPPKCSDLNRPDQEHDYEIAAMFMASMANFNAHFSRIYDALDGAKIDFGAIQSHLQQTFYPGITSADMAAIQGMNAGSIAIGLVSVFTGGVFGSVVNVAKETYSGIARGVSATLRAADASVQNMAELASLFSDRIDEVRGMYATLHDDVLKSGLTESTSIIDIFEDGNYVDDRDIPILHDISVEDVRGYVREMFFAMIINNAWLKQGAYIFSREMEEEECNEYSFNDLDDMPTHLCRDGRIYWLNKYRGATSDTSCGLSPIPGWEDLEKEIGPTLHDAMMSSIDAFNDGGYEYNGSDEIIDDLFDGDIEAKVDERSRYKGIWNIPVCEVESSDQYGETGLDKVATSSLYWQYVDGSSSGPGNLNGNNGLQPCLCASAKDHSGVSIKEYEDIGDGSFRGLLDTKEHESCNLKGGLTF